MFIQSVQSFYWRDACCIFLGKIGQFLTKVKAADDGTI